MKKLSIMLMMCLCFVSGAFADDIGYVDMEKVFMEYSETKKAQKVVKNKQEKLKKDIEKRQKKIEKAKSKGKSESDIKELIEKMEEELEPKRQGLIEYNIQTMAKIKQDILNATKEVAKSYGISVVLNKQIVTAGGYQHVVMYGGFDLTNFVLDKINE